MTLGIIELCDMSFIGDTAKPAILQQFLTEKLQDYEYIALDADLIVPPVSIDKDKIWKIFSRVYRSSEHILAAFAGDEQI